MAVSLVKGQRIEVSLSKVKIGLGWDPNETDTGYEYDLDASAFCLNSKGKCPTDAHFVFYGNKYSPDMAVEGAEDDLTGGSSDGDDDEMIQVDLTKVASDIDEIIFVVTIYEHDVRKQNFGQVNNSYIRLVNNDTGEVIAIYELDEDFSTETAIEFGRLYRRGQQWKFQAIGQGYNKGLDYLVIKYGLQVN
ncbi:MAG: TerD family protein [Hyphomicrobiales bacterium]